MTRPYRPSNGDAGMWFEARWCMRCERDREWNERDEDPCEMHNNALLYYADEPGFPTLLLRPPDA